MSTFRMKPVLVLLAVCLVGGMVGAGLAAPARAQAPRQAVCTTGVKPEKLPAAYSGVPAQSLEAQAGWISEQIAQGRTNFTLSPVFTGQYPQPIVICAW
ncbi:MAG: hypothetical protein ACOZNI_07975 [Myxococcota bacterium]